MLLYKNIIMKKVSNQGRFENFRKITDVGPPVMPDRISKMIEMI